MIAKARVDITGWRPTPKPTTARLRAGATPTVSGSQGGDTVTGLAEAYADANAGTDKTLDVTGYTVGDGNRAANYDVSLAGDTTGAIDKAGRNDPVTPYNVTYDAQCHTATATATGVLGEKPRRALNRSGDNAQRRRNVNGRRRTFSDADGQLYQR